MTLRQTAFCAALSVALAQTATPASACEGPDCKVAANSKAPGKPLQLGKFMRPTSVKHAARTASKHGSQVRRSAPGPAAAYLKPAEASTETPQPLPVEAASAYASQPPEPVRVVASDEFNDIDRAAAAVPAETTGTGRPAEPAVQFVDATEYNDIDRKSDEVRLASLANASGKAEAPAGADQAGRPWIERLWARLQYTFIALAAAVQYLLG